MKRISIILVGTLVICLAVSLTVQAADPAAVAMQYVQRLATGDFAGATNMHDAGMKAAVNTAKLQSAWESLIKQMGAFKSVEAPFITEKDGLTQVYLPCRFELGLIDLLVVVNGDGLVSGLRFVPHQDRTAWVAPGYADVSRFREIEVTFGDKDWPLKGTMTVPTGASSYPMVVLVHGSGPNDRDETVGPNKMFKDIAWGLASRGIAVFRYDKRTNLHGDRMNPFTLTVKEEVVDDAVSALKLASGHPGVTRVYLLGHSLGATLAPFIAREAGNISGVMLLAGSARHLNDIVTEQIEYLSSLDGKVSPEEQAMLDDYRAKNARLMAGTLPDNELLLGMSAYYLRDLWKYDALAASKQLTVPMLFLQGERDYQVTMKDFGLYKDALLGARFTFKSYPALNHLFMAGEGRPNNQEYLKVSHVDPQVISDLSSWILQ